MKKNPSALLYPLSLLLVSGAWQGSSDLTCVYDSMETVACDWTQSRNATEEQCKLISCVESGYQPTYFQSFPSPPPQTCHLHGTGTTRSCELIFDEETYSLTVSDVISVVVSCRHGEKWRNYSRIHIHPFENLQLRAPHNVQMESERKSSYNLTWQLYNVSYYLNGWLQYEVRYKKPDDPDEGATILPINNDQQWVKIETLSPGTVYEAAVRVKVKDSGYKSRWSDWSSTVKWKTYLKVLPEEPSSRIFLPVLLTFIISFISIFFIATVITRRPKWVQKVLKSHLPDPAKFFPSLTAVHRGDVQKWLSSPLSMDSFHIAAASSDVSVLEVLQKSNQEPCLLLHKECPIPVDTPEISGHSLSSSFVNHGYFFFHHLNSLEIEPCKVYFTYDPFAQENSGSKNDDSYQAIHTTGNHPPLASYSLMGSQEDVSLLQEMKEPAQKVHQTINPLSMERSPASAVKQDETQRESKAINPASIYPHQSAMGVSNVHEQPSSNTNEIEAIIDVRTHTTSIGDDAPSFFQPVFLNQGKASDLSRTASTSQIPNFEAYVSLRELQSKYSHQSV